MNGAGRPGPGDADPTAVATAVEVLGPRAQLSEPLGPLTTYRVGGAAAVAVRVSSEEDLALVALARRASGLPVLVIGRGSNLLVADDGFAGLAVLLDPDAFGATVIEGSRVTAGAAVPLPVLARRTSEAGLTGLEWAVGVPGSVGGGIRMNAGGHGSDIAASLVTARVADLSAVEDPIVKDRKAAELSYGYRTSAVADIDVVVAGSFGLRRGDRERSLATIHDIVRWRRDHQPGGQNAGSVFTNPDGPPPSNSAGWLIEASGMKGYRYGTAMVSPKHANFIQADPGGTASDIAELMSIISERVAERHGVVLHPEVRMVGRFNPLARLDGEEPG